MRRTTLGAAGLMAGGHYLSSCQEPAAGEEKAVDPVRPLVIATWPRKEATAAAWDALRAGGSALDAAERGVMVQEADQNDSSVGYGGRPDREGNVTLDACVMDETGNAGSVCALQNIKHPVSVARKVMEETPHVMLVGEGALQFALEQGFEEEDLLTEASREAWQKWLETSDYQPVINVENHDTIGMVTIDGQGNLSGACTTSGLAYKMAGRVGDSPIIGAGLFVDNEVGGAVATGMGEAVLKSVGSFLVVELMRQGYSPEDACKEAVMRIVRRQSNYKQIQVGYAAVNKAGEYGAYCIQPGFSYTVYSEAGNEVFESNSYLKTQGG